MQLFCPGPVNQSVPVKTTAASEISHRSAAFRDLYKSCNDLTVQLFHADPLVYQPLFLTGSGTLAIEAMVYACKGKKVLLLRNGFFAEKWDQLLQTHRIEYSAYQTAWGTSFDREAIRSILQRESFSTVFLVHHETSTTMINNLEPIDAVCKEFEIEMIVDAVSSVGLYEINLSQLSSISYLGYSTNKCIGSYPGLAVVLAKQDSLKNLPSTLTYLNLKLYSSFGEEYETPFTPCVQNFFYYKTAVEEILQQPHRREWYERFCKLFLEEMKTLGIVPYLENQTHQCCWVVNLQYKEPSRLYEYLYKRNIVIYKCKGPLQNSCIQVAFLNKTQDDIHQFVVAVQEFLHQ